MDTDKIIDTVISLYTGYSNVHRKTTQPLLLEQMHKSVEGFVYDPESLLIRERLIEHVGCLPIMATALYPYIKDDNVHLGDTLTMLAIHDIGELITGDEMAFTKKKGDEEKETIAALSLLDPMYHSLYEQVETQNAPTGKFAKALDKIAPDFVDYMTPADITAARYKHFMGLERHEIVPLIVKFKRPYMLWNPFMTELHVRLIERFQEKLG